MLCPAHLHQGARAFVRAMTRAELSASSSSSSEVFLGGPASPNTSSIGGDPLSEAVQQLIGAIGDSDIGREGLRATPTVRAAPPGIHQLFDRVLSG